MVQDVHAILLASSQSDTTCSGQQADESWDPFCVHDSLLVGYIIGNETSEGRGHSQLAALKNISRIVAELADQEGDDRGGLTDDGSEGRVLACSSGGVVERERGWGFSRAADGAVL